MKKRDLNELSSHQRKFADVCGHDNLMITDGILHSFTREADYCNADTLISRNGVMSFREKYDIQVLYKFALAGVKFSKLGRINRGWQPFQVKIIL